MKETNTPVDDIQSKHSSWCLGIKQAVDILNQEPILCAIPFNVTQHIKYYIRKEVNEADRFSELAHELPELKEIGARLVLALEDLQDKGFVHAHLNPDEIEVSKSESGDIKVRIDRIEDMLYLGKASSTKCARDFGNEHLSPPEYFLSQKVGRASDVWLLGAALAVLSGNELPIEPTEIQDKDLRDFLTRTVSCTRNRLGCGPDMRVDWSLIKAHPLFCGIDWNTLSENLQRERLEAPATNATIVEEDDYDDDYEDEDEDEGDENYGGYDFFAPVDFSAHGYALGPITTPLTFMHKASV